MSTPPASKADLEAVYNSAIENRTQDILKSLALTDATKENHVHETIIAYYRSLRARDEIIDSRLKLIGQEVNYQNRASDLEVASKKPHEKFLAKLSADLTPQQVDIVKDKMTYNKVKVTYDGYNNIVPNLSDADKSRIMELLKAAREEAMDGGSAPEKSAIFQKYKNQINDYLTGTGHDLAKAFSDWAAKHPNETDTNTIRSQTVLK